MDIITNFKQDYELLDYEKHISNKDKILRFNEPDDTHAYQTMMDDYIEPLLEANPHIRFHYFNVVNDNVYAHFKGNGRNKIKLENHMTGNDVLSGFKQ